MVSRVFFSLHEEVGPGNLVSLSLASSHHLLHVLRLTVGAEITAVDLNRRRSFRASIASAENPCSLLLGDLLPLPRRSVLGSMCCALLKGNHTDEVCEKATELGAEQIVFWQATRSIVRLHDDSERRKKEERLRRVAEAAAKQSEKDYVPEIAICSSIEQLLDYLDRMTSPEDSRFLCSLNAAAIDPRYSRPVKSVAHLVVGPEGDLTSGEEELLTTRGFESITLGPYRLRSETAALAGLVTIQALWGGS